MNQYLLVWMAEEKMREAEKWAREARLKAALLERIRAGERRRLGVQLGRANHGLVASAWLVATLHTRR